MEFNLPKKLGLIKLPKDIILTDRQEIAVFLIKAELKNRKFSEHLELVGFDPANTALDLGSAIIKLLRSKISYETRAKTSLSSPRSRAEGVIIVFAVT